MKKFIFLNTVFSVMLLTTLVCSAAAATISVNLGTARSDFSWSTNAIADEYSLSFTVDNANGVKFSITMEKPIDVWFFDGSTNTWNSSSGTGTWESHFANGSYNLKIYGSAYMEMYSGDIPAVPIPGALMLFGSGIFGLFFVRRFKAVWR
ncbi:MAG: PEP-CTERM sorting domain-containing protein [Desulfamplus sp.]|nr:PEP-CTERM sorting domain-containing protein [Desulfamplus sp.]